MVPRQAPALSLPVVLLAKVTREGEGKHLAQEGTEGGPKTLPKASKLTTNLTPTMREVLAVLLLASLASCGDINRQSIVFYEETPDVFYCPQEKPISLEGMIVKAKPLKKLCEYEGKPPPKDYM